MARRVWYSRHSLPPMARAWQRALEIVPGLCSWGVLVGLTLLAFWQPLPAAALIMAFYLYWLLRLLYLTLFLVLAYGRLAIEQQTDWMARLQVLDAGQPLPARGWRGRYSAWLARRRLELLRRSRQPWALAASIYHVVIVPIASESRAIYEPGLRSLSRQTFPAQRILVVLAVEARAPADVREAAAAAQAAFRDRFLDVLLVLHPDGLPGEARVKGANAACAAKAAAAELQRRHIPFERVVVSCFDADTNVTHQYFACLTYHFLVTPQRLRASFQPIPVYHNNIWEVPAFARVIDLGASFFQLVEATNPEKLVTFSSHSMSFKALVDVGYWPVDMISDDSAIFWKAYLAFEGDYRVVPMYITVSMDIAASRSWLQTIRNVYRQKRRWAWGVENFPLIVRGFWRRRRIRLWNRWRLGFKMLESHLSWATWPLLVGVIGWLPVIFARREFSTSVMYYSVPRITRTILHLASIALCTTIVLSLLLLPRPRGRWPLLQLAGHVVEWLFFPIIAIGFSALPALDAQTRLMLGRYMEFWVTEKTRGREKQHGASSRGAVLR